ncbi:hypothetical protein ACQEVZ_20205 [Dactylosporangium sp. CA-152071]|uniref:hypothetical protein n=1 Tax=Dactylosporangium sp. CA-152071 TaxID=3239933 RepID=UPI003D90AA99
MQPDQPTVQRPIDLNFGLRPGTPPSEPAVTGSSRRAQDVTADLSGAEPGDVFSFEQPSGRRVLVVVAGRNLEPPTALPRRAQDGPVEVTGAPDPEWLALLDRGRAGGDDGASAICDAYSRGIRVGVDRASALHAAAAEVGDLDPELADALSIDASWPRSELLPVVRYRTAELDLLAAALNQIRDARAHSCDQSCTEGGCDFDLGGFVDRVDAVLADRLSQQKPTGLGRVPQDRSADGVPEVEQAAAQPADNAPLTDAQVRTVSGLCEAGPDGVTCIIAVYGHRRIYHGGRPVPALPEPQPVATTAGPAVVFKLVPYATRAHTECRLYAGPDRDHLALCGELRLRHHEYTALQDALTPQPPAQQPPAERQCFIEEPHAGHRWYAEGTPLLCPGFVGRAGVQAESPDSPAAKMRSLRAHPHGSACTCDDCTARDEAERDQQAADCNGDQASA